MEDSFSPFIAGISLRQAAKPFSRGYRAFFFYLRSAPCLILEILILESRPAASSSAL
jgi:hypothetical protein